MFKQAPLQYQLGGTGFAVSTFDLELAIRKEGDRLTKLAKEEQGPGLYGVAENVGLAYGQSGETVFRRLYDIRHTRSRTVNARLAEILVDVMLDDRLETLDIPTLPRSLKSAAEMVEAWTDLEGIEAKQLARSLFRFSYGYVSSFEDAERELERMNTVKAAEDQAAVAEELIAA